MLRRAERQTGDSTHLRPYSPQAPSPPQVRALGQHYPILLCLNQVVKNVMGLTAESASRIKNRWKEQLAKHSMADVEVYTTEFAQYNEDDEWYALCLNRLRKQNIEFQGLPDVEAWIRNLR